MANMYAVINDTACQFPIVDQIVEIDRSSVENLSVHSTRSNGSISIAYDLFNEVNSDTNRIRYEDFLNFLKEKKVTAMTLMNNTYKIFVDVVIYDASKQVIEEGIKIHEVSAEDMVKLYEVSSTSELQYVFTKKFHTVVPCNVANAHTRTFGINGRQRVPRYVRIRNISIRADYKKPENTNEVVKLNQTLIDTTISRVSPTISDVKEKMIEIYNSCGTNLAIIDIGSGYPRSIELDISVTLDGFIVPYNDVEINKIIDENIGEEEPEPTPPGPDDPDDPDNPGCDCSEFFSQYERCSENDVEAKVVVADADYDPEGDCYKYSDVKKDIPDIKVGEYVKYVESLVICAL